MASSVLRHTFETRDEARPAFLANHHFDSRRWDAISFRSDDIVISSWAKSGTTWLQQIVCQLVHDGREGLDISALSPWVDFRITPIDQVRAALEAQPHRRVMKSHLPADSLPLERQVRYLYIAREPADVVWSWYRHHHEFTDEAYEKLNSTPGRVGPPLERPDSDFRAYFRRWLAEDGHPFHPYWSNVGSWWERRRESNIRLVHFADLRRSLESELRRLADFLSLRPSPESWGKILRHCSLDHMKANAELVAPLGGAIFKGGAASFIRSGRRRQWEGLLDEEDLAHCLREAARRLPADCVAWLFDRDD
ncbi:MAG TPA: sulfotransferase domain-containing protein [Allosphingosinicella sp.]|nr:sulfotransferase domain-containing protein [Allosphingosinicella sp.]